LRQSALKTHIATAHNTDLDLKDEDSTDTQKHVSEYEARRAYRCQECENPDVSKSPFNKHVVIALNRTDVNRSSSINNEVLSLNCFIATAHITDLDLKDKDSIGTQKHVSEYEARRAYRCQECENPDVSKSPFNKHIVIALNRTDVNRSSPINNEVWSLNSSLPESEKVLAASKISHEEEAHINQYMEDEVVIDEISSRPGYVVIPLISRLK
jgi:signal recognition particle receptor subunit beta